MAETPNRHYPLIDESEDPFIDQAATLFNAIDADVEAVETDAHAHKTRHENGGSDEINVAGLSGKLADAQTPLAHKTSHQDGGTDEISLTGLSGVASTAQKTNPDSFTLGGTGATSDKLYSKAGLQNAFEWGGRVETDDGALLRMVHDVVGGKREVALHFGGSNPERVSNGAFLVDGLGGQLADWTASDSDTRFARASGGSEKQNPEGVNNTDESTVDGTDRGYLYSISGTPETALVSQAALEVGKTYLCSGWLKLLNGTGVAAISFGGVASETASVVGEWKWVSEVVTASDADIELSVTLAGTGGSSANFKNISAIEVTADTGYLQGRADGTLALKDKDVSEISLTDIMTKGPDQWTQFSHSNTGTALEPALSIPQTAENSFSILEINFAYFPAQDLGVAYSGTVQATVVQGALSSEPDIQFSFSRTPQSDGEGDLDDVLPYLDYDGDSDTIDFGGYFANGKMIGWYRILTTGQPVAV